MITRIVLTVMLVSLSSLSMARATTYNISRIDADHGDPQIAGTLAWYFVTYGPGHVYRLSSSAAYWTSRTLLLPEGATLTVADGVTAAIRAGGNTSSEVYDGYLIVVGNDTTITGRNADPNSLRFHANYKARHAIGAANSHDVVIRHCTVSDTLNTYNDGAMHNQALIHATRSVNLTVDHCVLRRAGYPALNIDAYDSQAGGIELSLSTGARVLNSDIAYTLGPSIAIAASVLTEIRGNILQHSGLISGLYGKAYSSDSIIGYHNTVHGLPDTEDRSVYILNNTIRYWHNHGVHVSGRGIHIQGNTITDGTFRPIYLGDWRSPDTECSSDSTITNNYVGLGDTSNVYSIWIDPYKDGTVVVSNNSGPGQTNWGETCVP